MVAARGRRGLWGSSRTISGTFPHFYCSTRASACSWVRDTQNSPSEEFKNFLNGPITISASFPPSLPSLPERVSAGRAARARGRLGPLEAAEFPAGRSRSPIAGETARSRWPRWGEGRLLGSRSGVTSPEVRRTCPELGGRGGRRWGAGIEDAGKFKNESEPLARSQGRPGPGGVLGLAGRVRTWPTINDPSSRRPAPARPVAPGGFTHPEPPRTEEQLVRCSRGRGCLPAPGASPPGAELLGVGSCRSIWKPGADLEIGGGVGRGCWVITQFLGGEIGKGWLFVLGPPGVL